MNRVKINTRNLQEIIAQSNSTQREIAKRVGIDEARFSRIKNGKITPDYDLAEEIRTKAFGFQVPTYKFYQLKKPIESFTPKPRASEEAINNARQHSADKNVVRKNLEKLSGSDIEKLRKENAELKNEVAKLRGFFEGVMFMKGVKA